MTEDQKKAALLQAIQQAIEVANTMEDEKAFEIRMTLGAIVNCIKAHQPA